MQGGTRIASSSAVTPESTVLFTVRTDDGAQVEAFLTRFADGVAAFRNFCSHWTDVRLDRGSGAPIRNGEIMCRKHGATFEKDTGFCNFGPCEGAYLDAIDVVERDDAIYLADDDYTFEHVGEAPSADEGVHDRSTSPGERLGF